MGRRLKGTPPSYCLHKQSGQAVFNWPLGGGKYKSVLLGLYGTPGSHTEYQRVLAEWQVSTGRPPVSSQSGSGPADLSLYEIALDFERHARRYYRHPDGEETGEADNFKDALVPLLELYGHTLAREFGPKALRVVQRRMIEAGLARRTINARINRVRRFFRWAASHEMIAGQLVVDLQTVAPLRKHEQVEIETDQGRVQLRVKESNGVHPIDWERVEAVLPILSRPVAGMVGVMRHSNCRAEDVVSMRGCDMSMNGEVWLYRPASHKNQWREEDNPVHKRVVHLGPRCQEVLRPFLKPDPLAYLFSPREARSEYQDRRAALRKTKRTPSENNRATLPRPQRAPRDRYDVNTFQQAIRRACQAAGVPVWTLLEVRHTRATEVREAYGVEGAAASLGDTVEAAQIYAEKNAKLARQIAEEFG